MASLVQSLLDLSQHLTKTDLAAGTLFLVLLGLISRSRRNRSRVKTTQLHGPTSSNPFVGLVPQLFKEEDPAGMIEKWVKEFGPVLSIPVGMGRRNVILADVKAAEHFLARDTGVYHQTGFSRVFIENLVSSGLGCVGWMSLTGGGSSEGGFCGRRRTIISANGRR